MARVFLLTRPVLSVFAMSASPDASTPPQQTPSSRSNRENTYLTTNWWEMLTHAHEVPCMGKAMGYGGLGGIFVGGVNRFIRGRT